MEIMFYSIFNGRVLWKTYWFHYHIDIIIMVLVNVFKMIQDNWTVRNTFPEKKLIKWEEFCLYELNEYRKFIT